MSPQSASSLAGVILLSVLCVGCLGGSAATFLGARDNEIKDATRAIEIARDDAQRAKAYSSRGAAYSEKARYGRIQKVVPDDEYERLFALAIRDHDQAVSLNPASAEIYFNRAQAYYDRGSLDLIYLTNPFDAKPRNNKWLHAAVSDFEKAVEKDPHNGLAFDRLGLTYESNNETDKAVQAYTREMALDERLGKQRLAQAYCVSGYQQQLQKDWNAAVAAYQKSIDFGVSDSHDCPVEPFEAIVAIYIDESPQLDKAREIVEQAKKAGRRISPELLNRLNKTSARGN